MFRRMTGCKFCSLLPTLGVIVGVVVFLLVWRLAGADLSYGGWGAPIFIGGGIGWMIGARLCQRLSTAALNRVLDDNGRPIQTEYRVTLSDKGVSLESERQSHFGSWSSVSDLMLIDAYWSFVCDGMGLFVPRRFFETPGQEQTFLAKALSHMTERARARSLDAADVAAGRALPGARSRSGTRRPSI